MKLTIVKKPWGYEQHYPDVSRSAFRSVHRAKMLVVYPGAALSFQYHKHREEHWTVLSGSGLIWLNQDIYNIYPKTEWFIPKNMHHRVIAQEYLVIREESFGDVWNDEDIVRLKDNYERI